MYKNYFFLSRFIVEVNSILNDSVLVSAFSQEKDKLILEIKKERELKYLEISVNPGFPYITLRDTFHRAKKNSIDFFSGYLPTEILSFEIAGADRTIRLKLKTGFLFFTIRGKYTNVTFQINSELEHFKNPPEDFSKENFLAEQNATNFIKECSIHSFRITGDKDIWKELKIKYPFIGKEILSEIKSRIREENKNEIISALTQIIKDIYYEKPAVFLDQNNLQVYLGISSFNIYPLSKKIVFEDIVSAFNFLLSKKFNFEQLNDIKKKIQRYLDKELSHLSARMNKLKGVLESGSKEKEYRELGNLLLINISSIHKGMKSIELKNIYSENRPLIIKLNENLSPQKNIDSYFEKAKNDRIRLEKSQELFRNSSKKYLKLKKIGERFKRINDPEGYYKIMEELNLKEEKNKSRQDEIQNKFKHYKIENKYNVFVGKNNTNNDLLTLKFARQNDYWFHARSVPGSHVVLRVESTKEIIPKSILKKAASLAAYHSKAKTAGTVPVSFTFKKYVVKKKGMEPGKVALLREDTLLVKPEIPDKCEYIEKDLS